MSEGVAVARSVYMLVAVDKKAEETAVFLHGVRGLFCLGLDFLLSSPSTIGVGTPSMAILLNSSGQGRFIERIGLNEPSCVNMNVLRRLRGTWQSRARDS